MTGTTDTYHSDFVPLLDDDEWHDHYAAEHAHAVGLPDPPAGRIWLLRSPWPRIPVWAIYEIIHSVGERNRTQDEMADVHRVATEVLTYDEQRALGACPVATRELIDAWADAGRVGEAAAELIERQARTRFSGPTPRSPPTKRAPSTTRAPRASAAANGSTTGSPHPRPPTGPPPA